RSISLLARLCTNMVQQCQDEPDFHKLCVDVDNGGADGWSRQVRYDSGVLSKQHSEYQYIRNQQFGCVGGPHGWHNLPFPYCVGGYRQGLDHESRFPLHNDNYDSAALSDIELAGKYKHGSDWLRRLSLDCFR